MKYKMTQRVKDLTNTRKRQFAFDTTTRPQNTDSYWSGGSRSLWRVFNLNSGAQFTPPPGSYPWTTRNDYTLQPGDVLIETGDCCGKPMEPRFLCRPEDEAAVLKWLGISLNSQSV